jgi:hypothetical protein
MEQQEKEYTKLTTKVKRGSGTRDQDTTKITTRHPDPSEAVTRHRQAVKTLQEFASEGRDVSP